MFAAKLEVRFSDEQQVFRAVNFAVSSALSGTSLIHQVKDVGSMEDNNSNLGPSKTELVKNKLGTSKSLSSHAEQTTIGIDIKQQQSHYTTRQIEQSMEIEQPRQIEQSMRIDQPKQIEQEKQIEQQMKIEQEKRFENISKPPHIVNCKA